jgi:hypothetical protein
MSTDRGTVWKGRGRTWLVRSALVVLVVVGALGLGSREGFPQVAGVNPAKAKTAYSLLQISATPPHLLDGTRRAEAPDEFGRFCRTQVTLIKSRFVCSAALRDPKVARLPMVLRQKDPVAWLGDQIAVDFPLDTEIMRIAMAGDDTAQVAPLVNAVTEAYFQEVINVEHNQRLEHFSRLKDAFNDYTEKLKDHRRKRADLALATGLNGRERPQDARWRTLLTDCERDLRRVRLEKAAAQARLDRRKADKQGGAPIAELEEGLAVLEVQEKYLSEEADDLRRKDQEQTRYSLELETLREEIDHIERTVRQIGEQTERLAVELQAPKRVKILHLAEVPK